jgi:hypothetical protein
MAKHRLIPGYEGGTYHPWNVIEVPDYVHHDIHFARWIETGDWREYIGSVVALNATKNGAKGKDGWISNPHVTALKGAETLRKRDPQWHTKMAKKREASKTPQERSANSAKGWASLTPEQRAERDAKRLATRQANKLLRSTHGN